MGDLRLAPVETRFAEMIWRGAPMTTGELVKCCASELNWKRTTTYTVLKRLCDRGLFALENGVVTVIVSREEFDARQSGEFVEESFGGSLPAFLAAFSRGRRLTQEEIDQIQRIIDEQRG